MKKYKNTYISKNKHPFIINKLNQNLLSISVNVIKQDRQCLVLCNYVIVILVIYKINIMINVKKYIK